MQSKFKEAEETIQQNQAVLQKAKADYIDLQKRLKCRIKELEVREYYIMIFLFFSKFI